MSLSFSKRLQLALLPPLAAWTMRALGNSWRIKEVPSEGRSPLSPATTDRFIYAYWHEYIIPTVGHYRGCPIHALASQSFDGELITATMLKLGYPMPARGSSSRGGVSGFKELLRGLQSGNHVAVTVDGPRGPRRVAQDGVLKLSELSGKAIIPVGFATSSTMRFRSWDRTMIPLPFAKGAFCLGEPMRGVTLSQLQSALDESTLRAEEALL